MITFEGLEENLKFIAIEVENQTRSTVSFINQPSRKLYESIITKDDYIDNLKTIIENKCFSIIHTNKELKKKDINRIRSIQTICVNLERIADFCVNIVRQMSYLEDYRILKKYDYDAMMSEIQNALSKVLPVLSQADLTGALVICKAEYSLDQMYKVNFDRIMEEIKKGLRVPELITILFIFRYIERIGDSLLNIGEALIFSIIGEKIKIEQFQALQTTLSNSGFQETISEIDFQAIWGTRSGCRIGRVGQKENGNTSPDVYGSIFKEGTGKKISMEKANLERWNQMFPGLVAKVYGYNEDKENASLLVEYLPGCTLDEVILTTDLPYVDNALFILQQMLAEIWEATSKPVPASTNYIQQILSRQDEILRVHSGSFRPASKLGDKIIDSTPDLLQKCLKIESQMRAPFTVMIHGDFNVNNILYDHSNQRIHFIDLYRSRDFDYVKDVSVFLISNFRMPIFEPVMRDRLNHVIQSVFEFAHDFAVHHHDKTFDIRMAFALSRSFFTSARFELNSSFAKEMVLRSHFLMEKIVSQDGMSWETFQLPLSILFL
ncbi:MAG: phosphotransferase [Desulfobacterales bacterium]|jgi:phosphate uptake regulator|nr:phosphotransferase [Desulfobacterales bacterium]